MSNKDLLENIKKLREMTGVGFKDCKLALDEANGDIEKSIEFKIFKPNRNPLWFQFINSSLNFIMTIKNKNPHSLSNRGVSIKGGIQIVKTFCITNQLIL